jgi:hypothetical protein
MEPTDEWAAMPINMEVIEIVTGDTYNGGKQTRLSKHDNHTLTISMSTLDAEGRQTQNANVTLNRVQTKMLKMLLEGDEF